MARKTRLFATLLMCFVAVTLADAQYGGLAMAALNSDDAGIVLKEPCIWAVRVESTSTNNRESGTRYTEQRKWRDSEGRFRREVTQVQSGQDAVFHAAVIIDPKKNTVTTLNLDARTASVVHLQPNQLHSHVELDDKPMYAMPGVQVKVEKLSGKKIAGVDAEGQRVTRIRPPGTIGNDHTISSVSERWVSPELKIVLATSMDDPRQQSRSEVTQLTKAEPDASLFQVPAGYSITEAEGRPTREITPGL